MFLINSCKKQHEINNFVLKKCWCHHKIPNNAQFCSDCLLPRHQEVSNHTIFTSTFHDQSTGVNSFWIWTVFMFHGVPKFVAKMSNKLLRPTILYRGRSEDFKKVLFAQLPPGLGKSRFLKLCFLNIIWPGVYKQYWSFGGCFFVLGTFNWSFMV